MKYLYSIFTFIFLLFSCETETSKSRVVEDFNTNWKFHLGDISNAETLQFEDNDWRTLNVPHDWSIEEGYQKEGDVASSTGFVPGGIGWYRKSFTLNEADKEKIISVLFDGIYNNSTVWVNGYKLGTRPNGYISFSYDLTEHLKFDGFENVIAIKVNRTTYVDSRWYTGSGIYRNVKLIKTAPLHIKQWGTKISTPEVSETAASVLIKTELEDVSPLPKKKITLKYSIVDNSKVIASETIDANGLSSEFVIRFENPKLWSIDSPNLYQLKTEVFENGDLVDNTIETFGIRTFNFDANTGFSLNGKRMKIKGVNLHHDVGALGAAATKSIWEYRMRKLKSIGTNAVRFAHNPHSPELLEVCDEMGLLVMNEAFDEWSNPKGKSKVYLGDNAANKPLHTKNENTEMVIDPSVANDLKHNKNLDFIDPTIGYPEVFNKWAERDLKDLIKRDYNHPSVIMWSIGNEIEWTYPHYSKTFNEVNPNSSSAGYDYVPIYDAEKIKTAFEKNSDGTDPLVSIARNLVKWVKEEDNTRPTVCGSVLPSVGMVSGYGTAVDVFGFNYRESEYDIAHQTYPDLKILGTENWNAYSEWKAIKERDFVSGIFTWTGFAYMGEAGPWPRKGLDISLFDFAGFKTPRGHFFETLWAHDPKVYMVTTPADESEFSYSKENGWKFNIQLTPPPVWNKLRLWEWYKVYPKWNYSKEEPIIVQTYTNCEEAELFLNGTSLGKQKLADVVEYDHILKWLVPYSEGELKIVGYNDGKKADEYTLASQKAISKIEMNSNKITLDADDYDIAVVDIKLVDENGTLVTDADTKVTFSINGEAKNIGVDNGWEMNVQPHKTNSVVTHHGRAVIYVQATKSKGNIKVEASIDGTKSNTIILTSN